MIKKAFITGIGGQDGSHLAEFLHEKGYEVHGLIRRASFENGRFQWLEKIAELHYGDMLDGAGLHRLIDQIKPDEVYNLAAQSDVRVSFDTPEYTTEVNANGTLKLLEAIRKCHPEAKFYQASTSEMFGKVQDTPQNENTPFYPRSPYGVSKLYAHWIVKNYRESYGLFAACGILFNHESERRGEKFVSRKITKAVANIVKGKQDKLVLGDLTPKRDWGYATDYVKGMWMILQHNTPEDFVLATGETHSVEEFVDAAFKHVSRDWKYYVEQDPKFMRPAEVNLLLGDSSKAKKLLGWETEIKFEDLVRKMVEADLHGEFGRLNKV